MAWSVGWSGSLCSGLGSGVGVGRWRRRRRLGQSVGLSEPLSECVYSGPARPSRPVVCRINWTRTKDFLSARGLVLVQPWSSSPVQLVRGSLNADLVGYPHSVHAACAGPLHHQVKPWCPTRRSFTAQRYTHRVRLPCSFALSSVLCCSLCAPLGTSVHPGVG